MSIIKVVQVTTPIHLINILYFNLTLLLCSSYKDASFDHKLNILASFDLKSNMGIINIHQVIRILVGN